MSNYVILSEKSWNTGLCDFLNRQKPEHDFFAINRKSNFTSFELGKLNPSIIFIPHWSYIIEEDIYENYECIVFHMTDLPYGRGGSPLQNLIARGHTETKVSAIQVVEELDAGPIYLKRSLQLLGTAEEIYIRANQVIAEMILHIINEKPKPKCQDGEIMIFKRRTSSMSNIQEIQELPRLYDHIRMLDAEGYPKAYIETENFKIEFTRASLRADKSIIADARIIKK